MILSNFLFIYLCLVETSFGFILSNSINKIYQNPIISKKYSLIYYNKYNTNKSKKFITKKFMYPFYIVNEQMDLEESISKIKNKIKNKIISFMKLIRIKNILPTILLNFSGGWIVNPSLNNLLNSKSFIISIITTILIMSSSMIINDIVDVNIDKINNPNKPLVSGSIKIKEAFGYLFVLLIITKILSHYYFNEKLQKIINLSILNILLYTPALKKIPFIKNISCAFLVSFSVVFSSLATGIISNPNFQKSRELLKILFLNVFYGSFYNEVLLDICDREGDKKNNIYTIPVIYGNKFSINLLLSFATLIFIYNMQLLKELYDSKFTVIYPIIFFKSYYDLLKIKNNNYNKSFIIKVVNNTNIILFLLLLYICILVKIF